MMTFTLSCWAIGLLLLLLGIAARHAAIREVARARAWPQVQGVIVGATVGHARLDAQRLASALRAADL